MASYIAYIPAVGATNYPTLIEDFITDVETDVTAIEAKTNFITVTQVVNLDTIEANSDASKVITDFITVTQAVNLDTIETNSDASKIITDWITVTQAVNLDTIETNSDASKVITDFISVTQVVDLDDMESKANDSVLNADTSTVSMSFVIDEDTMVSDSATKVPTQQSTKAYIDGKTASLNTKILEIGDWDMDAISTLSVAHGLTRIKIRTISVVIRNDDDTQTIDFKAAYDPAQTGAVGLLANSTNIAMNRSTNGPFDNTFYNSTSYNRGWITIQYTD